MLARTSGVTGTLLTQLAGPWLAWIIRWDVISLIVGKAVDNLIGVWQNSPSCSALPEQKCVGAGKNVRSRKVACIIRAMNP